MLTLQARFEAEQRQKENELLEQQRAVATLELERQRNTRQALVELVGQAMADLAPMIAERGVEVEVASADPGCMRRGARDSSWAL